MPLSISAIQKRRISCLWEESNCCHPALNVVATIDWAISPKTIINITAGCFCNDYVHAMIVQNLTQNHAATKAPCSGENRMMGKFYDKQWIILLLSTHYAESNRLLWLFQRYIRFRSQVTSNWTTVLLALSAHSAHPNQFLTWQILCIHESFGCTTP